MPETTLTSQEKEFVATLRPGDVLLFDSARPLSGLIKFGENRPVNHSGLYLGDQQFAEATSHAENGAVRQTDLLDHLGSRRQRTVTAFRHIDARGRSAEQVLERAHFYLRSDTAYDYQSLYRLILPSLYRSYRPKDATKGGDRANRKSQHWLGILTALSNSSLSIWDGEDPESGKPEPEDTSGLTCSEFVYRCFSEAEYEEPDQRLQIEVIEPLTRIQQMHRPRVRGGDDTGVLAGPLILHENITMEAVPDFPTTRGARTAGSGDVWAEMAKIAGRALETSIKGGLLRLLGQTRPEPDDSWVVPDTVTPRDLWSSPSLRAFSVFHRPPGPEDEGLEDEL